MGDSSDKLSAGKKKISVENHIYSVVGLEASNLVPLVSLEGGKSNFIFLFQHRQMMSHYQRESPDMSGVLTQLQQGCGCRSKVLLGQMLRVLLEMPRVLTSDLPPPQNLTCLKTQSRDTSLTAPVDGRFGIQTPNPILPVMLAWFWDSSWGCGETPSGAAVQNFCVGHSLYPA